MKVRSETPRVYDTRNSLTMVWPSTVVHPPTVLWDFRKLRPQAEVEVPSSTPPRKPAARLSAIVRRAHTQGLWVRFYTLNGHEAATNRGWTAGYNFGSAAAVRERWPAAFEAGVDFGATDQYEDFARMLPASGPR